MPNIVYVAHLYPQTYALAIPGARGARELKEASTKKEHNAPRGSATPLAVDGQTQALGVEVQRALEVHGVQQHSAREHLHTCTSFVKIEGSRRYRLRNRTPSCQSFACSSLTSTDSGSSSRYSASLSRCHGRFPAPCAASMASTDSQYETVVNSATSPLILRNCCMPRQPGFFSTSSTPFS